MTSFKPIVGHWLEDIDEGQTFKVLAIDEDAETVVIQYLDGNVEEINMDSWHQMNLDEIDSPENCPGLFDDVEPDDFGDADIFLRDELLLPPDELDGYEK